VSSTSTVPFSNAQAVRAVIPKSEQPDREQGLSRSSTAFAVLETTKRSRSRLG
jgi:hypothetical protein